MVNVSRLISKKLWLFPFMGLSHMLAQVSLNLIPADTSPNLRIFLLNVAVGLCGFFTFWVAALFCEYLDFVLFTHLLADKRNDPNVVTYRLPFLDTYFEVLYNFTKSFVPYEALLDDRKIIPMLPEKDFWTMAKQVLENFASSGVLQFTLFYVFDVIHFRPMTWYQIFGWFWGWVLLNDLVFYSTHVAGHRSKTLYKLFHELHHSSFGTKGISAMYSHWLDFLMTTAAGHFFAVCVLGGPCKVFSISWAWKLMSVPLTIFQRR
eukprot:TRINITY_DN1909_c0_g1_i1.p1 TRINITY_DN1909_c0_g1~~TRINITY_DN1909_c0_g1_i1.p1  ORF type:complete len:263 (-),score=47.85 TRINITY_DN1909_c0_g1_i1:268-1056(-)